LTVFLYTNILIAEIRTVSSLGGGYTFSKNRQKGHFDYRSKQVGNKNCKSWRAVIALPVELTAAVRSSQAPTATVEKSLSASNTKIQTLPPLEHWTFASHSISSY
jgi:hypothetical protein